MSCGALILHDVMIAPPKGLVHGQSIIFFKWRHGRFKRHSRISLSSIKEECPALLSESLTTEAASFPTKAELSIFISLHESLARNQF